MQKSIYYAIWEETQKKLKAFRVQASSYNFAEIELSLLVLLSS